MQCSQCFAYPSIRVKAAYRVRVYTGNPVDVVARKVRLAEHYCCEQHVLTTVARCIGARQSVNVERIA